MGETNQRMKCAAAANLTADAKETAPSPPSSRPKGQKAGASAES